MNRTQRKRELMPDADDRHTAEQRRRDWLVQNREALDASNTYVEQRGLPLERHRLF